MADEKETEINGLQFDKACLALKREAHKRGAPECAAPSLIWHLGIWPPKDGDPQNASNELVFNKRLGSWIEEINDFLARLQRDELLTDKDYKPRFSIDSRGDPGGAAKIWRANVSAVEFDLLWRGLRVQVKAEMHSEHASVTFLTNLEDGKTDEYKARIESAFEDINGAPEKAKAAAAMLYETVWTDFIGGVLSLAKGTDAARALFHPGQVFVSLRGVVPVLKATDGKFSSIARAVKETFGSQEDRKFDDGNGRAILKATEYFLTPEGFAQDSREFVACRMMSNQALFVSTLGAVDERRETQSESNYNIRYALFTAGKPNQRQLGRLVELIDTLGTLQIIGIKDLEEIREVGTQIRLTGDELDELSEEFHKAIEADESNSQSLELELCKLERELERISEGPIGGLQYRVARSRYYAKQFEERLKDLELDPIRKWQSYDVFARRRLMPAFAYIDSVGQRMINLRMRLHTILESVQTKTLIEVNDGVLKIQSSEQWQTLILFIVAVAAFFGEVVEPLIKMGGAAPAFVRRQIEYFGQLSTCDADTLEIAARSIAKIDVGEVQRIQAAKEVCGALYKFVAYADGISLALAVALIAHFGGAIYKRLRVARKKRRLT